MKTVALFGVARSGTSWLGQVFNSSPEVVFRFQPLFSYEFKGRVNENSTREEYERLFEEMVTADTPFLTQADKQASGEYPRFEKLAVPRTLVFKENRYQSVLEPMMRRVPSMTGIGIVRHPCGVLDSWSRNAKEFPLGSDIRKEWRFGNCKNIGNEDYFGYYKWKEVTHLYLDLQDKYPDRFRIVQYEDLVNDPMKSIPGLFDFCHITFEEQTRRFLQESGQVHTDSYYAVYKNKSVIDRWREMLDPGIIEEVLANLKGTRLERFAP